MSVAIDTLPSASVATDDGLADAELDAMIASGLLPEGPVASKPTSSKKRKRSAVATANDDAPASKVAAVDPQELSASAPSDQGTSHARGASAAEVIKPVAVAKKGRANKKSEFLTRVGADPGAFLKLKKVRRQDKKTKKFRTAYYLNWRDESKGLNVFLQGGGPNKSARLVNNFGLIPNATFNQTKFSATFEPCEADMTALRNIEAWFHEELKRQFYPEMEQKATGTLDAAMLAALPEAQRIDMVLGVCVPAKMHICKTGKEKTDEDGNVLKDDEGKPMRYNDNVSMKQFWNEEKRVNEDGVEETVKVPEPMLVKDLDENVLVSAHDERLRGATVERYRFKLMMYAFGLRPVMDTMHVRLRPQADNEQLDVDDMLDEAEMEP